MKENAAWPIMNCQDAECAAELGLSLGVPEVLTAQLAYQSGHYTLKLARVSTRTVHPLRESVRTVGMDASALITPVPQMVDELYPSDRSCRDCAPPPGSASESAPTPLLPQPVLPQGPDVTWMFPAIFGAGASLAITVVLGLIPFAVSAVILPAFTGWWLANGKDFLRSEQNGRMWTVTAFLLPAVMGIPLGLAAPVVAGTAGLLGWYLPTWLWRRDPPSVRWVLAASLIAVMLGAVAAVVPIGIAGLAATAVTSPFLFKGVPLFTALPVIIGLYAAAWVGAAVVTYTTGLFMFLVPPAVVGLALARDSTPLRKGEDEEPLPVDEVMKSFDDDKHSIR